MHLPYVAVFFVPILCSIVMVTSHMSALEIRLRKELVDYAESDLCVYMRSPDDGPPLPQYNEQEARRRCGKAYSVFRDLVDPRANRVHQAKYESACPDQSEPYQCDAANKARIRCSWKCDGQFKQLVDIITASGIQ